MSGIIGQNVGRTTGLIGRHPYNTPAFVMYCDGILTIFTNNTLVKIVDFDVTERNDHGAFDTSTSLFTVPAGMRGIYAFHCKFQTKAIIDAGEFGTFHFIINGVLPGQSGAYDKRIPGLTQFYSSQTDEGWIAPSFTLVDLDAGDTVGAYYKQNSGANMDMDKDFIRFCGFRVSS